MIVTFFMLYTVFMVASGLLVFNCFMHCFLFLFNIIFSLHVFVFCVYLFCC